MKKILLTVFVATALMSCKNENKTEETNVETEEMAMTEETKQEATFDITPIEHATAVFELGDDVFYIDPVGGAEAFEGQPAPDVILVTDIHGDHLNEETLNAVTTPETKIFVPQAVKDQLKTDLKDKVTVINNDEMKSWDGYELTAIPMYNLREEAKQFHVKGRGNGYVLEKDGTRIYFSGDTEDIPEMRNLKNIDKAFICMNLPYTMTVESAADGVIAFAPDEVYPYHFRGQGGLSDTDKFKSIVDSAKVGTEVIMLDWYPNKSE
ncbi:MULTISPECIES: MBL fold metallo-hydrolase [unclassified Leeuwenhoekiella]|uniref:MBL fold metallo-hydrolase n=1 Tax=unclassified Leeuwenhoekiella TaxID=2615029 RepID=UPI000C62DCE4|nr:MULTISPECIES: MBL fold metallo-hydrolase [unclassified Leeuwenhoekiella]MAW94140.1 MBL fold metallo-hydrolase [Leeuwenhoekiella sp.]MBA82437.1 MBL fold metallo-hydrolase [Leeuwenhoekiella sp.]|tara:strand:- start:45536 stop:46333 length:798 start_codon:yes stop_codon:yes gene_type:complete